MGIYLRAWRRWTLAHRADDHWPYRILRIQGHPQEQLPEEYISYRSDRMTSLRGVLLRVRRVVTFLSMQLPTNTPVGIPTINNGPSAKGRYLFNLFCGGMGIHCTQSHLHKIMTDNCRNKQWHNNTIRPSNQTANISQRNPRIFRGQKPLSH